MKFEQNTTTLSKTQQIKLLKDLSDKLSRYLDNLKWTAIYTDYLGENIKEEKAHNRFKPDGIERGLTVIEAARYFAVRQIVEYFEGEKQPSLKHYIEMRKTVFTAYSIAALYREEITKAFEGLDYKEVLKMDYCFLVQTDKSGKVF